MRPADDPLAITRATYDEIGRAYADANAEIPDSVRRSLELFAAELPAGALVADVGCGPGRDLSALRALALGAIGLDLSIGMLRAGGQTGVAVADMTRGLPLGDAVLHGLWCAAALLHIPRPLVPSVVAEFARVLRPNGRLHLSVAEGSDEGFERDPYLSSGDRWFVHHELAPLVRTLADAGLIVDQVERSQSRRRWLSIGAVRAA